MLARSGRTHLAGDFPLELVIMHFMHNFNVLFMWILKHIEWISLYYSNSKVTSWQHLCLHSYWVMLFVPPASAHCLGITALNGPSAGYSHQLEGLVEAVGKSFRSSRCGFLSRGINSQHGEHDDTSEWSGKCYLSWHCPDSPPKSPPPSAPLSLLLLAQWNMLHPPLQNTEVQEGLTEQQLSLHSLNLI